jgi:hypothetical protein
MSEPRVVEVQYKYHDDPQVYEGIIGVGIPTDLQEDPEFDDRVFYYVDTEAELEDLYDTNEGDFSLVRDH